MTARWSFSYPSKARRHVYIILTCIIFRTLYFGMIVTIFLIFLTCTDQLSEHEAKPGCHMSPSSLRAHSCQSMVIVRTIHRVSLCHKGLSASQILMFTWSYAVATVVALFVTSKVFNHNAIRLHQSSPTSAREAQQDDKKKREIT